MKKLLTAMFVALLMVGCGEKTHYSPPLTEEEVKIIAEAIDFDTLQERGKEGEEVRYAPNEQTPYTGRAKAMHDNGQIRGVLQMKDGKRDGLATGWYENGQKEREMNVKDGDPDGPWTEWYENGQKEGEGNWKDGKKDGLWIAWYENGQKSWEGTYKDGELVRD